LQSATECPPSPTPILGGLGTGTCPAGTGPATPWFFYINTPAEISGAEAELTVQPIDGLTIDTTLGWLQFESPDVHKDNLIQPEWNGSVGVQYAISLGNGATITPRTDWFYQGDMTFPSALTVAANDSQIEDAHWWGNVRLTYETADRDWSASLVVTNVADEFFYENRTTASNYKAGVPTRPREWGITFKRNFQ
jgi:iron complex outermembrane receptor protein